ncbi:ATP-binding protein [Pontibacillus marinus]|uniref:ATPase n=1 Tax=Pontibacillus marinus BH030004 = DSM 16465 TaxID=1385511 RepID=A0A0A5GJA6_9BACI|nr:sensor histidine kinase [Pontibacillus marinus]KGX91235.1 ATPase [Pontibacillus marinus BH030004 = DSM 16465]
MLKRLLNVSLQTKILGLVTALILMVTVILTSAFTYIETKQIRNHTGSLALQTAKTISYMPTVIKGIQEFYPSRELRTLATQMQGQVDADFVEVATRDGVVYSHTSRYLIGNKRPSDQNYTAIVFGGYYQTDTEFNDKKALSGKAPIIGEQGRILGVVTVGYFYEGIHERISDKVFTVITFSILALFLGLMGSIFLARNIRRDTLGLEPAEIAQLYRERGAILRSINEGLIAMDKTGRITLINRSARKLLDIDNDWVGKQIHLILPHVDVDAILNGTQVIHNWEMYEQGRQLIVTCTPVVNKKEAIGVVATFKDQTEIREMADTIYEVRQYSEDLRAQTHEFTNKMYILSGLLQLEHYDEALEMIEEESKVLEKQNQILFHQIQDPKVQAIILGKISKASEKKIDLEIDSNSSLAELPEHITVSPLVTILGNLIDNAFEAVMDQEDQHVSIFTMDFGDDIIFEVTDYGKGISNDEIDKITEKGFSTKGSYNHGFGLYNVKQAVLELGGSMDIQSESGMTTFTVYIPKESPQEGEA